MFLDAVRGIGRIAPRACAMRDALIVSSRAGWAGDSGLAGMLPWFSLNAHEFPSLNAVPPGFSDCAVAIVRLAAGQPRLGQAQLSQAGLPEVIMLTCGPLPPQPGNPGPHLPEPVTEGALAAALAQAGYLLPLPAECQTIAQHISQLVGDDAAAAAELVASLRDTNQSDLNGFVQACAACRWHDVRVFAHRIKGSMLLAGVASLARLSERVEILAQQGRGDAVLALAALYEPAVARLSSVLAALRHPSCRSMPRRMRGGALAADEPATRLAVRPGSPA